MLRNLSLRQKLAAITLATCGTVLILSSTVFVAVGVMTHRQTITQEVGTIAEIVAENSAAAVVFDDRKAAEQILAALGAAPNIVSAEIHRKDGTVFARYRSGAWPGWTADRRLDKGGEHGSPNPAIASRPKSHDLKILGGYVDIFVPMRLDGELIAGLFVRSNLLEMYTGIAIFTSIALCLLLLSSVMALLISGRLQRAISRPIFGLLDTMRVVSADRDYSLTAEKHGDDELGRLVDGFNAMLGEIQSHDEGRREAQQQAEAAQQQAHAANRAKSEFLANMSHELRTPLNAIIGFSDIIHKEVLGPDSHAQYRDYAGDINGSGQHLLDLINDILDLSKVEAGRDELCEDELDVHAVIDMAITLTKGRAEQHSVRLTADIPDQLPALYVDERKLKQILMNLLSNAIKFTLPGGKVTLSAWCRMESGFVFQVADTGIGIALEDIPKAMSTFGQVDSDLNRKYDGTGLGLPLVKSMVEQHGGSLDLQSEIGVGTTVTARFPANRICQEAPVDADAENQVS